MSLYRLLFRRSVAGATISARLSPSQALISHSTFPHSFFPLRTFAFSSAEEAAAERRRRKRRLRIEPPLHALRRDPSAPRPPPDPNAPRLPDSTSALVGPRLNLHNRVQSLIRAGDLDNASALARQAVFSRTRPTVFTCNAIIAAMYRAKRYDDAIALFNFFFKQSNIVPNVVSYNFLIVSQCESGQVDEGLEVYRHIIANAPFSPSSVTYRHLTKGLIDAGRIGEAMDLLREMLSKGHGADSLVYNNLIRGFLDLGDLGKANELFDELKERCLVYDGVVSSTFMDWFFEQGREKEAMESYKGLLDRQFRMTPATCNVLLECLLKHKRDKDAWELFDTMLDNHTPPNFQAVNSDTFNIMVNECFRLGKFDEAVAAFRKVGIKVNSKPFSMDVAGYNNIVVRFAEQGMTEEAEKFFEELRSKSLSPDVTGYRTLIDSFLKEKRLDDALQMFHLMVDANLRVIPLYANKWLAELIENGKVLESSELLIKLGEKDPKPDVGSYEIVIKGLCKAESFDQCKEIISQMMRYSVGVTPTLREFILDIFEKEGQKDEIEKLLDPKTHNFGSRWQGQSNGASGSSSRPAEYQGNASPRFPQSVVSSGPLSPIGNQSGAPYTGSVGLQRQTGGYGSSYESSGASSTSVAHAGYTYTGSSYHAATQGGLSSGYSGSVGNGGQVGYSGPASQFSGPSGHSENSRNQAAYKPAEFSAQPGSTGSPYGGQVGYSGSSSQFSVPSGYSENSSNQKPAEFSAQAGSPGSSYGGHLGYRGSTNQYAAQTGSWHSGQIDNGRNQQGTYESSRYSPPSGSRFPEPVQNGGHQTGQWWSHQSHRVEPRGNVTGESAESAGFSREVGVGNEEVGYTASFGRMNR